MGRAILQQFTSDELLIELARRESFDGKGGVLFHRVRVRLSGEGVPEEEEIILEHRAQASIERSICIAEVEVKIDGDWRVQDWIRDQGTAPRIKKEPVSIHRGQYD